MNYHQGLLLKFFALFLFILLFFQNLIVYFTINFKARQIREEILGKDTPDTATVYNNLGCNMMMLGR